MKKIAVILTILSVSIELKYTSSSLSAQAQTIRGNFCNVQKDGGWWFWRTGDLSTDACSILLSRYCTDSGCRVVSSGTYLLNGNNNVYVSCRNFQGSFSGMGGDPFDQAYQSVTNPFQPSCIFQLTRSGNQPRQPTPEQPTINPSGSNSTIAQEMLAAHNQWRSRVGVPPLRWSPQLTSYAQEWANYLASTGQFNHRPQRQYGENLFWGSGRRWSPTEVVNNWGSEVRDYDYASNRCRNVCGHYTQVVWARTTEVGCAVGRSGNQEVWVCNYNPPGNYIGQRPY